MTDEDLAWIEAEVNARIRENAEVVTRLMTPDAAVQIGAMALFGEKYGDEVRVVSMGHDPAATEKFGVYSLELCGGTHVRRTGDIGLFKIVSEGAVAAGVRRVEAVTGEAALRLVEAAEAKLKEAAAVLRVPPADLPARIATLVEERRKLERDVADLRKQVGDRRRRGGGGDDRRLPRGAAQPGRGSGARPEGHRRGDPAGRHGGYRGAGLDRRGQGQHRRRPGRGAKGKADAVTLVRAAAAAVGGKGGGGRPEMAQAGGPDGDKADEALAAVRALLAG